MKLAIPIDPDTLFTVLEEDRHRGVLAESISSASVRYQSSQDCPGALERIGLDGTITLGNFDDGRFVPHGNK